MSRSRKNVRLVQPDDSEKIRALIKQSDYGKYSTEQVTSEIPMIYVYERDGELLGMLIAHGVRFFDGLILKEDVDKRFVVAALAEQAEADIAAQAGLIHRLQLEGNHANPTAFVAVNMDRLDAVSWTAQLRKAGWEEVPENFRFFTKTIEARKLE